MWMELTKLTLVNFQSFSEPTTLDFTDRGSGLYLVSGANLDETKLGANGAGKSTIFNALCWVLFGKTTRGLRAGNVRSWDSAGTAKVELEFKSRGNKYTLLRTWNPNLLVLLDQDGQERTVVQSEIDDLIGFSFDSFLSSVVMGQFTPLFLDLSPTEKLSMFSTVLGLDFWLECSEKSSQRSKELAAEVSSKESEKSFLNGSLDQLLQTIADTKTQIEQSSERRRSELESLEEQIFLNSEVLSSYRGQLSGTLNSLEELDSLYQDAFNKVSLFNDSLSKLTDEAKDFDRDRKVLERDIKTFSNEIDRLTSLGGGVCHNCLQDIPHGHVESEATHYESKLAEITTVLKDIYRALDEIDGEKESIKSTMSQEVERLEGIKSQQRDIKRNIDELNQGISKQEGVLQILYSNKKALMEQEDLESEKLSKLEQKKTRTEAKIATLCQNIDSVSKTLEAASWWVKGFKQLRLYVVERALLRLNLEMTNALSDLGLTDWTIECSVERETKSGTISKEFNVYIKSPACDKAVPWEAWSGGETQRLRLAGAIGLSSLIQDFRGNSCNVEVWDEPTHYLDGEGISMLLTCLANRAKLHDKQIYLIDHRSLDFGGFSGKILVQKSHGRSTIHAL